MLLTSFFGINPAFSAPPGAPIANQAELRYQNSAGTPIVALSNEVTVITAVIRTPSTLAFTRVGTGGSFTEPVGPAFCAQGGSFVPLANPVSPGGGTIDPSTPQDVTPTSGFNLGETLFLRLEDADQNVDYLVIDTVDVGVASTASGDVETIRLSETGPDTGVFAGYIPSVSGTATSGDCVLQGQPGTSVTARYVDVADTADQSSVVASLDPLGVVFDSRTGDAIDGATIRLVDAVTGLPATVFGNDGVSVFPADVVSGTTVTDSGGTSYVFAAGQFRFPTVPAGDYRLEVDPPGAFSAPSTVSEADLQALPNAPFQLGPAAFGATFTHDGAGPFAFDYPIDPQESTLFLQKSTTATLVAPGDFVRYQLRIENTSTSDTAQTVRVSDRIPAGTRYVPGSAALDGAAIADPIVNAADEMMLEFTLGNLAGSAQMTLSYVLEIVSGQRDDELVNVAVAAADGGILSNASQARIRVAEDLFRSTGTLMGRVVEGSCALDTFEEDRGVAGVRVYLEDGRYAVTDEGGRFHFEGLKPGTHVAQLDTASVPDFYEISGCDANARFAGKADSQFVDLTRGSLVRANFYLQRKLAAEGRVNIELEASGTDADDAIAYEAVVTGTGNIPVSQLNVMLLLPDGMRFTPGSMRVDGQPATPRSMGQSLTVPLEDQTENWSKTIAFVATIDPEVAGDLTTRAIARFSSPAQENQQTPVAETLIRREAATWDNEGYVLNLQFGVLSAELSDADRHALDQLVASWRGVRDIRINAVGHSDSVRIAARNRHLFADNYALSEARARAAAEYLAAGLSVSATSIQVEGRGPTEPVASNETPEGRSENRRVELVLGGQRPGRKSFVKLTQASSGTQIAETRGLPPGVAEATQRMLDDQALADHLAPPQQLEAHINSHAPGIGWVLPEPGFRPAIPALKISVKHELGQQVALFVNGLEVNPLNFDGTEVNTERTAAVSRWVGVDLLEGTNQIVADIVGANGLVADRLTRQVHYAGAAVRGEFVPESSHLVADGRTRPVVAVRLFDRFGEPARHSTVGAFSVDAPYRSWWDVENDRGNDLVHIGNREPLYTIGDDGVAFIELEPTTQSGMVTLRLKLENQRVQEMRSWLKPQPRDWILVGFGEGTVGYSTLEDNMVAAGQAGFEDGYYDDGRVAFFAKGQVKGEYLLTIAYDSARDRDEARRRFETEIDPTAYYTLYADNTEQRFEAPSQSKLYLKLERNQFAALFGDFTTGLSTTELSRYERRFNGLKAEYHGQNVAFNAFAAETDQSFVRDEIQGDGTSGLYRLSTTPLVMNSETIRIEVRDRFDTAVVLSSDTLSRFLDYNLDPIDGTVFFKQPVASRDANLNPIYIVAEYETRADVDDDLVAGGRVAAYNEARTVEVGVTHVNEQQQLREGDMTGVDLRWQLGATTVIEAEYAESSRDDNGNAESGSAQLLSVEHRSDRLDLRAQYREVDQGFGLGQQTTAERGIRKYGVDARLTLSTAMSLKTQAVMQENLETGAERTLAEADFEYKDERTTASIGVTHAEDSFLDGSERTSNIVDAGVSRRLFDSALTVRANGSVGLGGEPENADYLSSFVFGFDYEVLPEVDVFVEYENAEGRDVESEMSRVGVRASPWNRAQFQSSLNNEMSEFGPRLFANVGLIQGFQVNENWVVDVGFDQTRTLRTPGTERLDDDRELAFGTLRDDFVAGYVGTLYQSDFWSVNSRVEYRESDVERRTTLLSGWYREPRLGRGMSAGLQMFASDRDDDTRTLAAELRFGWAYRPADSRWAVLNRLDLEYEDMATANDEETTWRIINNLNVNRRIDANAQLAFQYAFKYVRADFDTVDVTGYTDLIGVDLSRGFKGRWEAGIHTSVYHSWESDVFDYGIGVDLGYNAMENLWVSVGYNFAGFHDEDFAAARYTAQGPYLTVTLRAHQDLLKKVAGR